MKFFDAFLMAYNGDTLICGIAHVEKQYSCVETMTALHQRGLFSSVDRDDWEVIPQAMRAESSQLTAHSKDREVKVA